VIELSKSSKYDTIITVMDSISKKAHFIPIHIIVIMEGATRLFLYQVWKLHRLPRYIISDYGPQFIALFTRELY